MISRNKNTKLVELQVYAILLETDETSFITLHSGFSLEDAIIKAKIEFLNVQTNIVNEEFAQKQLSTLKVGLFTMKDFSELKEDRNYKTEGYDDTKERLKNALEKAKNLKPIIINDETRRRKMKMKKPISKSNLLMMKIIKNKDLKLLDMHKRDFTKAEIQYLKDKINK